MTEKDYQLEQLRKKALTWGRISIPTLIASTILLFLCVFIYDSEHKPSNPALIWISLAGILLGGIGLSVYISKKTTFEEKMKTRYAMLAAQGMFENFSYEPNKGIWEVDYSNLEFANSGNSYKSEDYCAGYCKGIEFRMADVRAGNSTKNSDSVYFTGQWIELGYEQEAVMDLGGDILLVPRGFSSDTPYDRKRFLRWHTRRQRAETGDALFDATFHVFASKKTNFAYILTPDMKERLLHMAAAHKNQVLFGFVDGRMYVLINNEKDMLKCSLSEPIDEKALVKEYRKDFETIAQVIEELGLVTESALQDLDDFEKDSDEMMPETYDKLQTRTMF